MPLRIVAKLLEKDFVESIKKECSIVNFVYWKVDNRAFFCYDVSNITNREENRVKKTLDTKDLAYMALFAAIITICSWISIPMTIPFTMQTFAIFVTVGILGTKRATLTVLSYILLGVIGLPVFQGFSSGPGALFGNTGGYIIGFLFTALIAGGVLHQFGKKTWVMVIAMVLGLLACYLFGTAWFIYVYGRSTGAIGTATAISWCVTPYIIPDLVKIALSIVLIRRVSKYATI